MRKVDEIDNRLTKWDIMTRKKGKKKKKRRHASVNRLWVLLMGDIDKPIMQSFKRSLILWQIDEDCEHC